MEPQKNLLCRMLDIMAELDYIQKGDAKVNGQYRFVSHDQVTAKIHPLLVKHRVLAIPSIVSHSQEGNRTVAEVSTTFMNVDKPEDKLTVRFLGYGVDSGDKGPGKAVSYAFKYAILKVFCLETGDDPDYDAKSTYEPLKCVEFDSVYAQVDDVAELNEYLEMIANTSGMQVEDLKRKALDKVDGFLKAYKSWSTTRSKKK